MSDNNISQFAPISQFEEALSKNLILSHKLSLSFETRNRERFPSFGGKFEYHGIVLEVKASRKTKGQDGVHTIIAQIECLPL